MMPKFVPNKYDELCYMPPILADNLDHVVQDFYDVLDEFPDPVFKWLDERLPHENAGPGTWSVDMENDQETAFQFTVANLPCHLISELSAKLVIAILEKQVFHDDYRVSFKNAWFRRTYYSVVRFAPESATDITHITYHVYWKVAN